MEPILFIDFETRSACDIKKAGAEVYARHESTDILCVGWAFGDGPARIFTDLEQALPLSVLDHVFLERKVVAHNAPFELAIWNEVGVKKYGWPVLKPEQTHCTMAMAYAMALPGSLENAAAAAGITAQKDSKGRRVMLQLAQPRSVSDGVPIFWEPSDVPEKFQMMYDYCRQDVEVERELYNRLLKLTPAERKVWLTDYTINNRGVRVDQDAARVAIELADLEQKRLDEEMRALTHGEVYSCRTVADLKTWLHERHGVKMEKVAKADVAAVLADPALPEPARNALLLRQEAAKTSTKKLEAMIARVCKDGRIRGIAQYHGAATGRWAGRGVQLQNLPRPKLKPDQIEEIFQILHADWISTKDKLFTITKKYGRVMQVLSDCIRGFIIPEAGKVFIGADFSAIEARVLPWLAGEEKVLNVFRRDGDIYKFAAADIYHVPVERVDDDQRQVGKVAVLALGFGGGYKAFQNMARAYNVRITDDQAERVKAAWREANPRIVQYWGRLENAARSAILNPGTKYQAGAKGREITYLVRNDFLFCRLPSGRVLSYPRPHIGKDRFGNDAVAYKGETDTESFGVITAWGGLLSENVTQAVAACLLRDALIRAEERGYPVVMHVHDEIVCEIKWDGDFNGNLLHIQNFENLMCELPPWAKDLPVKANGFMKRRYGK
jgi:DNA polymerase